MSRREEIRTLVEDAYAARKDGDVGRLLSLFRDDATFAMSGSREASVIAMEANGAEEIGKALAAVVSAYEMHEQTILSLLIDGEEAAVHHRARMRFAPTGEVFETDLLDLWKFDGVRIASVISFADTALAHHHAKQLQ